MYLHNFNYSHKFKNYKHLSCMGEMRKGGGCADFLYYNKSDTKEKLVITA